MSQIKDGFDRSVVVEWLRNLGMFVPAARLRDCGEGGKGWVGYCPNGHEIYHAFGCEQRICPRCGYRRAMQLQEKLTPPLLDLVNRSPGVFGLKHIVLGTDVNILDYMVVRDGRLELDRYRLDALREKVLMLRACAARMFRTFEETGASWVVVKSDNGKLSKKRVAFTGKYEGFGIGIEFGSKAGSLHFHVLGLGQFVDQKLISARWLAVNRGHGSYVDIRAVGRDMADVSKSIGYITKYITKPMGLKDNDDSGVVTENVGRMLSWVELFGVESVVAALAYVFKGVRRFQTYGAFFNLDFDDLPVEVCSVCGESLTWVSELEYIRDPNRAYLDFLKTLKTNNFLVIRDPPPDLPVQLILF